MAKETASLPIIGPVTIDGVEYFDSENGTIKTASLPVATSSSAGVIKVGSGLTMDEGALTLSTAQNKRYDGSLTGDGTTTIFTITHNLGVKHVFAELIDANDYVCIVPIKMLSTNALNIEFSTAPASGVTFGVVVYAIYDDNVEYLNASTGTYSSIPIATSNVAGLIKVGSGLSITSGVLSVGDLSGTYASVDHTHSGYAASSHTHSASDVGAIDEDNLVTSVSSSSTDTTVPSALAVYSFVNGNYATTGHTHSTYAASSHNHSGSEITSGTVSASYLPTASSSAFGIMKVGTGLSVSSGVVSVGDLSGTYATASHNHSGADITSGTVGASYLPNATTSTKGAVIVGSGLSVSSGTISIGNHSASYITSGTLGADRLPAATTSTLGGVIVGTGLSVSNGTISVGDLSGTYATASHAHSGEDITSGTVGASYLPLATTSTKGAIIIGDGLSIFSGTLYTKAVRGIRQLSKSITSGTITLSDTYQIYLYTPTANTTFTFTDSSIADSGIPTFELEITFGATAYTMTFPSTVVWLNGDTPEMSDTNTAYIFAFRKRGSIWVGNLQGSYATS